MRTLLGTFLLCSMAFGTHCEAQVLKADAGDWPWWRGPGLNGVAEAGQQPPVQWSETKNVRWKVSVPGRGHSSPTVVGDRILLSTSDEKTQTQSILCYDRQKGNLLWKRDVNQGGYPDMIHPKNSHASSTIAVHENRLYCSVFHHDGIHVVALDMNGEPIWKREAGKFTPQKYKNGYAASPLLYGPNVIVAGDFDGKAFLVALDRASGQEAWRIDRPSRINYSSPVVARVAGRDQLLLSGGDIVAAYDPGNGKQLWKTAATTMATAGTMVWDGDLVFASGGFPKAETVCIRADGSEKIVWRNNQMCYAQSMLAVDGHVYAVNDTGIALCWNAKTGKELWRERLRGPVSASPILCDGKIFISNELGTTWVYRASPERFELIAKNQLGSEAFATPAFCGSRIYARVAHAKDGKRQESLYCLQVKAG